MVPSGEGKGHKHTPLKILESVEARESHLAGHFGKSTVSCGRNTE